MAQNLIFIFTEGEHDAAFIYRILKANSIHACHSILIKDYPYPLNELFKMNLSSISLDELNIDVARSRFLPSRALQKDINTIVIYTFGGDAKTKRRIEFLKAINSFNVTDPDAIQAVEDTTISVLYFFDADETGIAKRIEQIKLEVTPAFSSATNIGEISNQHIVLIEDITIGAFIFAASGTDKGKLEDILIPLMQSDNDDIFQKATYFLDIHESTALFKGKVEYKHAGTTKTKVDGQKYDPKKSLIGTVGQLQKSGKSNTVCICDSSYLTDEKIKSDATCIEILDFIQKTVV